MASDSVRPRTGYRNWLLAAALSGTIAVTLGTGLNVGVSSAHFANVPSPVHEGMTAYTRPHATPVATATPAPPAPPAPVSRSVVVPIAAPQRAPAPASYHNRLVSSDGSINTYVGYYSDCSGRTALTHASAAIDTCVGGRTYFVGHNPGVFTPLFHMGVGTIITWFDGAGHAHRLRIVGVRTWYRSAGVPGLLGGAVAQFQTCVTSDGSVERIMDAAPA
jgi:hypothetical protein